MQRGLIAVGILVGSLSAAAAADMTGAEISALLAGGKTLTLGGPGEGYQGTLNLKANGTGKGSATTDKGDKIALSGKWHVKDDRFCRTWKGMNKDREVCETWQKDGDNRVIVIVGGKKAGVNSW